MPRIGALLLAGLGILVLMGPGWAGEGTAWLTNRRPVPPPAAREDALVRLDPRFDRDHIHVKTEEPIYLSTELEVVGGDRPDRKPLALAIVLDVSGSMSGERKLEHVVEATRYVVDRLTAEDRVAIVAYDSDRYEVYLPEGRADPAAARRALAKLKPGSGTNMEIGLRLGLEKLRGLGGEGAVRRLLLLSDGQANEGVHTIEGLARIASGAREYRASVSTFGVGADYNEDLMAAIAEKAGGNYYVIDRGAELADVFRKEFEELGSTVGTQVTLDVRPPAGLALEEAFGYPREKLGPGDEGYRKGAETHRITLRDLYQGMRTKVMMRFGLRSGTPGVRESVWLRLSYTDARSGERMHQEVAARFTWTESREDERASVDKEVLELAQEIESAEVLDRASREFERGNAAQAQHMLQRQLERNRSFQAEELGGGGVRLEAQNRMFDEAIRSFQAPAGSRAGKAAVKRAKQGSRMSAY